MAKLHLSPPWETYYNELLLLFEADDSVKIIYDQLEHEIKIYVDGVRKECALRKILPAEKEFGGVTLRINVVPSNLEEDEYDSNAILCDCAFKGNGNVAYIKNFRGLFTATYVVFNNEVVQYYDDNLGDINGNRSTIWEDIARRVLDMPDGIFFCTEEPDD